MNLYRWGNIIVLAGMYVALLKKANESDDEFGALSVFGWVLISANMFLIAAVVGQAVLLAQDWLGQETTVEQIFPSVRRSPALCSNQVKSVHPALFLSDCRGETTNCTRPCRDVVADDDAQQDPL